MAARPSQKVPGAPPPHSRLQSATPTSRLQLGSWHTIATKHRRESDFGKGCASKDIDVLKFMLTNPERFGLVRPLGVTLADERGDLMSVRWCRVKADHADWVKMGRCLDRAASCGHPEIAQWLHEHVPNGHCPTAMDKAAKHRSAEPVQWLHKNRTEGCMLQAMGSVASSGHLEIAKWLHDNRTEGCKPEAMNSAAPSGHLEVVK